MKMGRYFALGAKRRARPGTYPSGGGAPKKQKHLRPQAITDSAVPGLAGSKPWLTGVGTVARAQCEAN